MLEKLKQENEKQKKEIKLMKGRNDDILDQIRKLKQKNNEQVETICQYEAYIQEVKQQQEPLLH